MAQMFNIQTNICNILWGLPLVRDLKWKLHQTTTVSHFHEIVPFKIQDGENDEQAGRRGRQVEDELTIYWRNWLHIPNY